MNAKLRREQMLSLLAIMATPTPHPSRSSRLTLADLQGFQAEHLADDVPIDVDKMSSWTLSEAEAYFESGGTVEPCIVPAAVPLGRKPRIALLHGTVSNSKIFKMQANALLRAMQERLGAECHIIEGPLECEANNPQLETMKGHFGESHSYLEYARSTYDERRWRTYSADSLNHALMHCEAEIQKAFPGTDGADALVGFSQGAHLITLLAARAEQTQRPLRAAVMLSTSLPGWTAQMPDLFAQPLATPALIAWSTSDSLLYHPETRACGPHENGKLFAAATLREHSGPGHRPLPKDKVDCGALIDEICAFLSARCPES